MSETGQNVEASSEKLTGKKGNGSQIIIIILLVVLLIAAGIIIYLLTRTEEEPEVMDNRGTVITEDNASDVIIDQEIDDAYYEVSQTLDWHFNGTQSDDAYVANDPSNKRTVYFDLMLENGEVIYSSPYIPLGSEIKGITLDKQLDPGTYETIVMYHLVDDDGKEVSSLKVGLTIYVN